MLTQPTPEYCRELLSYIPPLPYLEWVKAVSAVANTFPFDVAHELLTSRWADKEPGETAYKMRDGVRLEKPDIRHIVNLAKQYGYTPKSSTNGANYAPPKPQATPEPDPVSFDDADESKVLFNAVGERVFRLAVNRMVVNKSGNNTALTHGYTNEELTLSQIAKVIRQGHALCASQMVQKDDGTIHRLSSNFLQSEMILLDFDYSTKDKKIDLDTYIPVELFLEQDFAEPFAMIYTSFSSTPGWNKYRGLLPLPYLETNPERYQKILKKYIEKYKADAACSDVCRAYYGNTKATIYNQVTGEVFHG
jgi:hypothetical protein